MVTEAERNTFVTEGKKVVEAGERWYATLTIEQNIEKKYPAGHFIIINVENGDYVVDKDEMTASKKAKKQFPSTAPRFVRKIIGPYPHIAFAGCMR